MYMNIYIYCLIVMVLVISKVKRPALFFDYFFLKKKKIKTM